MLTAVDNEATVLAVLGDRYHLPMEQLKPGRFTVATVPDPKLPARAFDYKGGTIVAVAPEHAGLLAGRLDGSSAVVPALQYLARRLGGHMFSAVARTGVVIAPPAVEVSVIDATDPRLPDWVLGHFTGEAWVVFDERGRVLSTAVLKRYDDRLREISVGTAEEARGRGLARSVVAAAARHVLGEGRAVLYNHAIGNHASARVAESVGLHELGRYHVVVAEARLGADYSEDDTAG